MQWSQICPVIISVFNELAVDQVPTPGGLEDPNNPPFEAVWGERKRPFINPIYGIAMYLKVTSVVALGWDEYRMELNDTGLQAGGAATGVQDLFETRNGIRKFVLQAQVWSLEDDDRMLAWETLERLRTRLNYDRILERFLAVNVDITDTGASRDMTASWDNRRWSIASMDITFTAAVSETDTVPIGYIGQVILTSHVQKVEGVDLPYPPNVLNELLPP